MTVVDMTVLYAVAVALRQIRARGYADKYRDRGEPSHLIGVEFGRAVPGGMWDGWCELI
ncbi:hypothetical protein ABIC99_002979 [Sphaerotilus sulfidivorans]|uniref:Uncharacterized protein n=1 Tax=Sphaerotilus sulfidivorans TaxID=639200 RepID=A0ABV2IQE4_9BURK|nr:hypothetical protein [Sphaerotilus sulfidivorans]NZD46151.1 hypothetical protein [Sphaerotilus sulfidivorans]